MKARMAELARITDALYRVELAKMQRITAEEQRVRQVILALDQQDAQAGADAGDDMRAVQALGADILWQNWVGRRRAALQMQLANILVRKAQSVDKLRHAFGKAEVASQLQTQEQTRIRQDRARLRDRKDQDTMLF